MIAKTQQIKAAFDEKLSAIQSSAEIEALRIEFMGKKGQIAALMTETCDTCTIDRLCAVAAMPSNLIGLHGRVGSAQIAGVALSGAHGILPLCLRRQIDIDTCL